MRVFFRSLLFAVPVTVTVLDVFGYVAKVYFSFYKIT